MFTAKTPWNRPALYHVAGLPMFRTDSAERMRLKKQWVVDRGAIADCKHGLPAYPILR